MTAITFTRRHAGAGFVLAAVTALALTGCGGSSSHHHNSTSGGGSDNGGLNGNPPASKLTLAITNDNAAAVLIQSRIALDLLPRLLVGTNVFYSNTIAVQGYDNFPPCANAQGQVQLLGDDPNQPTGLIANNCDDISYPRNFTGRLDLDFSNAKDPLSTFTGFADRIKAYDPNLRLTADGSLRLHPEDPNNNFGIAVAHQANVGITVDVLPGGSDTPTASLGFDFHDFTSRYSSFVHVDDSPYTTLSGSGDVTLSGLANGRVTLTTPRELTGPDSSNLLCYGDGVIEVDGTEGSSVRLDYNGTVVILSINGAMVESGNCASLSGWLTNKLGANLPPYL